jgi:hypothetical protein
MQTYRWTKVWAVQTSIDDSVIAGDLIAVDSASGESKQRVRSVTQMQTKAGKPYLTLLLEEVK